MSEICVQPQFDFGPSEWNEAQYAQDRVDQLSADVQEAIRTAQGEDRIAWLRWKVSNAQDALVTAENAENAEKRHGWDRTYPSGPIFTNWSY